MTEAPVSLQFDAIGTRWTIDAEGGLAPELERAVHARISEFDRAYSRFRNDSLVAAMAASSGRFALPPDAAPMLQLYRTLYDLTDGRVTPLVGNLMVQAGYDAGYSLEPGDLTAPPAWDDVLAYEPGYLTLRRPAWLDFGAAGKGYLVDLVGSVLEAAGLSAFTIEAGGDILHHGPTPLRVGLEHPLDPELAIGVVELASGSSICGSATTKRAWAGLHHIMDPLTAQPVREVLATWAIAPTALVADGLATALFFVPAPALATHFRFEYAVMHQSGSVVWSRGFPGEIFTP